MSPKNRSLDTFMAPRFKLPWYDVWKFSRNLGCFNHLLYTEKDSIIGNYMHVPRNYRFPPTLGAAFWTFLEALACGCFGFAFSCGCFGFALTRTSSDPAQQVPSTFLGYGMHDSFSLYGMHDSFSLRPQSLTGLVLHFSSSSTQEVSGTSLQVVSSTK